VFVFNHVISLSRKQKETGADVVTGTRYVKNGGVHGRVVLEADVTWRRTCGGTRSCSQAQCGVYWDVWDCQGKAQTLAE